MALELGLAPAAPGDRHARQERGQRDRGEERDAVQAEPVAVCRGDHHRDGEREDGTGGDRPAARMGARRVDDDEHHEPGHEDVVVGREVRRRQQHGERRHRGAHGEERTTAADRERQRHRRHRHRREPARRRSGPQQPDLGQAAGGEPGGQQAVRGRGRRELGAQPWHVATVLRCRRARIRRTGERIAGVHRAGEAAFARRGDDGRRRRGQAARMSTAHRRSRRMTSSLLRRATLPAAALLAGFVVQRRAGRRPGRSHDGAHQPGADRARRSAATSSRSIDAPRGVSLGDYFLGAVTLRFGRPRPGPRTSGAPSIDRHLPGARTATSCSCSATAPSPPPAAASTGYSRDRHRRPITPPTSTPSPAARAPTAARRHALHAIHPDDSRPSRSPSE